MYISYEIPGMEKVDREKVEGGAISVAHLAGKLRAAESQYYGPPIVISPVSNLYICRLGQVKPHFQIRSLWLESNQLTSLPLDIGK